MITKSSSRPINRKKASDGCQKRQNDHAKEVKINKIVKEEVTGEYDADERVDEDGRVAEDKGG